MITIDIDEALLRHIPRNQQLKIKLEIDTDPPPGFQTTNKYILLPIPFAVRAYSLPDLFAGKMHAVLCREWKTRVKGRDWYDFVWFTARHPGLRLFHLEARMRQTGHWQGTPKLTPERFHEILSKRINRIDINQARQEVEPFVKDPQSLAVWSIDFFLDIASRIKFV